MFIAPTEKFLLKYNIGICSPLPEDYGADILWNSELGLVGIQRKEFPGDFLASVHDGRLYREFQQMRELDVAVLLMEGRPTWTTEGQLIRSNGGKRTTWNKTQHRNYLASVQLRGIQIQSTDSVADTVKFIVGFKEWTEKPDHTALVTRPGPKGDRWGKVSNKDFQSHLLQSLPGIGPKQAEAIIQHFGGVPFRLAVSVEELMEVPGIGKGRAEKIVRTFKNENPSVR